jgi:small subunit ribosomal protein S3
MDDGAMGCHIIIAGKLSGQRHRTEKFKSGFIKFCGEPKILFMSRGYAVAKLKQGIVGVTVEIMKPGAKLPADITAKSKTEIAEQYPEIYSRIEAGTPAVPAAQEAAAVEPAAPEGKQ